MSEKVEDHSFTKSTTIISIFLTILGVVGIVVNPENTGLLLISIGVLISIVVIYDKINQVNSNTENINKIFEIIDNNKRIEHLEREVYEQKGKLSSIEVKHARI